MRASTPTLHCDAEDGFCGTWETDYYGTDTTAVNGVQITRMKRAPGWSNTEAEDYCPDHATKETTDE